MENVSGSMLYSVPGSTPVLLSWRAILYYLYTNTITFGRLSSQPSETVEDATPEEVENGRAEGFQLPPSSPKSVYTLACTVGNLGDYPSRVHAYAHLLQIGLLSLRGLAFEDFRSKIDSANITQELLSPFSAR